LCAGSSNRVGVLQYHNAFVRNPISFFVELADDLSYGVIGEVACYGGYPQLLVLSSPVPSDDFTVRVELSAPQFDYDSLSEDPMSSQLGFWAGLEDDTSFPYWVETEDREGTSVVWVKITDETTQMYIYAGDSGHTYAASPSDTFLLWEDAADYEDLSESEVVEWAAYTSITEGGAIQQVIAGWGDIDVTYEEFDNYIWVEYDMRIVSHTSGEYKRRGPRMPTSNMYTNFGMHSWGVGDTLTYAVGDAWSLNRFATTTMEIASETFTKVSLLTNSTGWYVYEDDALIGSYEYYDNCSSEWYPCIGAGESPIHFTQIQGNMVTEIKNIRARKQSSTDVVVSFDDCYIYA